MHRLVLAMLVLFPAIAHAEDKANIIAARKLLDTSLTGPLDDADPPTAKDPILVFPGEFKKQGSWSSWRMNAPYVGSVKIVNSVASWSGKWGWLAADLSVTQRPYSDSGGARRPVETHRYHLLQVYVLEGSTVKLKASMLTDTRPDAKLPEVKPSGNPLSPPSLAGLLVNPAKIQLAPSTELAVMGSSEREAAFDVAGSKKLLASWSSLVLRQVGQSKVIADTGLGVVASEVDLVVGGKTVRLRGMLVTRDYGTYDKIETKAVALSYGADSDFGDPKLPGR